MEELTEKQWRFVEEYLIDLNAAQAAVRAGYDIDYGRQLLAFSYVQEAIALKKAERSERTNIKADYVLHKLRSISDASIEDYVIFDGIVVRFKAFSTLTPFQLEAIESIKQGKNGIELKLYGKSWTLDMIAKHIGFYELDNKQKDMNVTVNFLDEPDNGKS